jgi:ligand-binding sensor domain-containing protein
MVWRRVVGALIVLASSASAGAAPRQLPMIDFVQDLWDAGENGPPHPGVTTILQTRDGYLWIATFRGVVRFDGERFRAPEVAEPAARVLLADHIRCMVEAPDGALWFGTRRQGVMRLKDGATTILKKSDGLPSDDIRALVLASDGTAWIGTSRGLSARDPDGRLRNFGTAEGLASNGIVALFIDRDGTLWVGTEELGLARFDGRAFQSVPLAISRDARVAEQAIGLPLRSVGALARDAQGVLWAGTSIGLLRVSDTGAGVSPEVFPSAVNRLAIGRDGSLWASTGNGLGRFKNGKWRVYTTEEGLITNGLMTVYEDRESSLWLGTSLGLIRLRPRVIDSFGQRQGLGHDSVSCIYETSSGDMWVGHRNGASRFSGGRWTKFGEEQGFPSGSVRSMVETRDGVLWMGTVDGLVRYDKGRVSMHHGPERPYSVRTVGVDGKGTLWVATVYGLDRMDGSTLTRVIGREGLCGQGILNSFYVDRAGAMWMGGDSALVHVVDGRTECIKDPAVLSRNDIRSLYEDEEGALWLGSIGGLIRLKDGTRETVTGPGPFSTALYAMLDDARGSYWFSTPQGLYRVEKTKLKTHMDKADALTLYRAFGAADGMATPVGTGGGVPNAVRARDGRLWFATAAGVAVVDPSAIEHDTYHAPVYIEELLVDRQPVSFEQGARLPAGSRDIELRFSMLSFVAPERVLYKYWLEGYDAGWIESGNRRTAHYANLAPGRYRFKVIAANHSGVWNDAGATIELELLPHLYERAWFQALGLTAFALLGRAAYSWRLRRVRVHERELEQRVNDAVAQIQTLKGLLPICASCKKIRDDSGYWSQMETYISEHTDADFTHSICPDCIGRLYPDYAAKGE